MKTRMGFRRLPDELPSSLLRRHRERLLGFALLCLSIGLPAGLVAKEKSEKSTTTYTIPVPPKPDFAALDWLIGEWTGKTAERDPQGTVHFSAAYEFSNRFMVLREEISLPATKTSPAAQESWMGILSGRRSDGSYVFWLYSSMGFVTRYGVTVDGGVVYFNQQGGEETPRGWIFRRVFERTNPSELTETIRVAPPDRSFFDYYTARLTRSPGATKDAPPAKPPKQ